MLLLIVIILLLLGMSSGHRYLCRQDIGFWEVVSWENLCRQDTCVIGT